MKRGVIFDLDGTILDSLDSLWKAFNAGVGVYKFAPVAKERLMSLMSRGVGLAGILADIYPELKPDSAQATIKDIMVAIRKDYLALCMDGVALVGGVEDLFGLLRERGLIMGMVTSRTLTPERMWQELERLGIAANFKALVTSAEFARKPAPDSVIECLKRTGLTAADCIFIGDSQADIRAGKAAGVKTVAVTAGVSPRAELEMEKPDLIFDNLHELIANLEKVLAD